MRLTKAHIVSMIIGFCTSLLSVILFIDQTNIFVFIFGIGIGIMVLPFVIGAVVEGKRNAEINEMFLEFSRNLAESVKAGTPVSKSIINLRGRNYGALSPHVEKLANQISLGIPVNKSMEIFAFEIDNPVISRAVTLIREAEKAGGEIDAILESSARSIAEIEKLRKERKSAVSTLVAQGYIIFFIFIAIMLVMEFKIIPLTSSLSNINLDVSNFNADSLARQPVTQTATDTAVSQADEKAIISPFLSLLLVQGFFAGLIIGKIAEGYLKAGFRHSFVLMMSAFLISTGARLFLG